MHGLGVIEPPTIQRSMGVWVGYNEVDNVGAVDGWIILDAMQVPVPVPRIPR